MAVGATSGGQIIQPTSFGTLDEAKKFAEAKNKGEEVIIQEDGKWVVYDMDDASQVTAVKEKVAKLDVAQVEFVGDYDAKTFGKENASLKSYTYAETVNLAKLIGIEPAEKTGSETDKDFMKRVQREVNKRALLSQEPGAKPDLVRVDGEIKKESVSAALPLIVARAQNLAGRQKAYGAALAKLQTDVAAYDKMPAGTPAEIKAKRDKYAELCEQKKALETAFPALKADAAAAKGVQLGAMVSQLTGADASGIEAEPKDPATLQIKTPPEEAKEPPKETEKPKPAGPDPAKVQGDPDINFKVVEDLNRSGNDDDDVGQLFVRCLSEPDPSKWRADDREWLNDHGYKPSDLKKIGVAGYARIYQGIMTGYVTGGEKADGHKFMRFIQKEGLTDAFMAEMVKNPKAVKEMAEEHGKKGMLLYVGLCQPETAKQFLALGIFKSEDFKQAAEYMRTQDNPPAYNPETMKLFGAAYAQFNPPMSQYTSYIRYWEKGAVPGKEPAASPAKVEDKAEPPGTPGEIKILPDSGKNRDTVKAEVTVAGGRTVHIFPKAGGMQFNLGKGDDAKKASDEDLADALKRVRDNEKIDKNIQAALIAALELERKRRSKG